MATTRKFVSPTGLALVRASEKFSPKIYLCPAGKPTIGYGHVVRGAIDHFPEQISRERAEALMVEDLAPIEIYLSAVLPALTQGEFDALADFCFNLGLGAFENSTLFKLVKVGDMAGAADQFGRWVHSGKPPKVLGGLVTRRAAERAMFLAPEQQPWTP